MENQPPISTEPTQNNNKYLWAIIIGFCFLAFIIWAGIFFVKKIKVFEKIQNEQQPIVTDIIQNEDTTPTKKIQVNDSTNDSSLEFSKWKNFSYDTRGFSIAFPATPSVSVVSKDKSPIKIIETIEAKVDNYKYSIDYLAFQDNFYNPTDSIVIKEDKSVMFYLNMLTVFYGSDLKYIDSEPFNGHKTKSFTISSPKVHFVGKVTGTVGKAYSYSTECDGAGCNTVPLQEEFLKSFKLIN